MTKEMCEGSGCKFEKNSVNFSYKERELMAKERNAKEEYQKAKERGWDKNVKKITVTSNHDFIREFDAKVSLLPLDETGKEYTRNKVIVLLMQKFINGELKVDE